MERITGAWAVRTFRFTENPPGILSMRPTAARPGFSTAGKYGDDSDVYLLINMHWEPHTFDLPHTGGVWRLEVDTAREEKNGICMEPLADPEQITLAPRSTVILVGETEAADER